MKYFTPWTTTLLASEVGAGHRRLRLTAIFSFLGGPEGSRRADRQQRARSRRRASSRCAAPLRGAGDGGHVRNRDLPRDPGGERAAAIAADLGLTLSAPGGSRSMPSRRDQDAPDQARASRLRTVLCGPRVDARKLIQYTIATREAYPVPGDARIRLHLGCATPMGRTGCPGALQPLGSCVGPLLGRRLTSSPWSNNAGAWSWAGTACRSRSTDF